MRKVILTLIGVFLASRLQAARPNPFGPLPTSCYADTEVSTNVAFALDYARLDKLHLTLECEATATNSLQVQIGRDADADGCLSIEEADLTFGYDCGEWFVREEGEGLRRRRRRRRRRRVEAPVLSSPSPENFVSGVSRRDLVIGRRNASPTWNLIRVTRRGPSAESSTITLTVEDKGFVLFLK